jgi:hypothetical protein
MPVILNIKGNILSQAYCSNCCKVSRVCLHQFLVTAVDGIRFPHMFNQGSPL